MKSKVVQGIVKTIVDGIKDAQMQYEYACEAEKNEEQNIAKAHIEEARKRLEGAQMWYKRAEEAVIVKDDENPIAAALMWHYREWFQSLKKQVEDFKT